MSSLTEFVNLLLRGEVLEFALSIIYRANLSGLEKKDNSVLPVAIGCTFRRFAMKVVAKPLSAEIGESLRPVQQGFSTRGGCEAAARAFSTVLE